MGEHKLPLLVFTTMKRLSPSNGENKMNYTKRTKTTRSTLTISNVEEVVETGGNTEQGKFSVCPALRMEMEPKNPVDLHTCTSL